MAPEKIPKERLSQNFQDKYNAEKDFVKRRAQIACEDPSKLLRHDYYDGRNESK